MKNCNTGRLGFTLIELLVVVMIIGILAAVALPQYQKAVRKSRIAQIIPILKSIATAEKVAYLANDRFLPLADLDIDVTKGKISIPEYGSGSHRPMDFGEGNGGPWGGKWGSWGYDFTYIPSVDSPQRDLFIVISVDALSGEERLWCMAFGTYSCSDFGFTEPMPGLPSDVAALPFALTMYKIPS